MRKILLTFFVLYLAVVTPASAATGPINTTGSSCGFGITTVSGQKYIYAFAGTYLNTSDKYRKVFVAVNLSENGSVVKYAEDTKENDNYAYTTTGNYLYNSSRTYTCGSIHKSI